MENPYHLQEMSKQIQEQRLKEAEAWRMANIAEQSQPRKPGLVRRFVARFLFCKVCEWLSQAEAQEVQEPGLPEHEAPIPVEIPERISAMDMSD